MTSLTKKLREYGDWAVVTGATSGIGKSFAHQLARAGVNVVLVSRSENVLKTVSDELNEKYGVQTRILALDLTESTAARTLESENDDLDVGLLVNNAASNNVALLSDIRRTNFARRLN